MCKCPGENSVTIKVGDQFAGCLNPPPPPPPEVLLAHVNINHLEAALVNGGMNVQAAMVVNINGNSFTLEIHATVPIDTIMDLIRQRIADYLGGDYTAADITLDLVTKRTQSATVVVSVNPHSSLAGSVRYSVYLALSLVVAALVF
jgi:hypothetical protein